MREIQSGRGNNESAWQTDPPPQVREIVRRDHRRAIEPVKLGLEIGQNRGLHTKFPTRMFLDCKTAASSASDGAPPSTR